MGQYDEYVSVFFTYISPQFMTYAELEHILEAIDEHMAPILGREANDVNRYVYMCTTMTVHLRSP